MTLFPSFGFATEGLQQEFENTLTSLPPVNFMVSDGFLWWTLESSRKFGFPRLVFYGTNIYFSVASNAAWIDGLLSGPESDNEPITLTQFPRIKITKEDFDPEIVNRGPLFEFTMKFAIAAENSYGMIFNSFYELEKTFADHYNRTESLKSWIIGPLCLAEESSARAELREPDLRPTWIQWLDEKAEQGRSVLYVAFGSQAEIANDQLKEITIGLEASKVNYFWVTRAKKSDLGEEGFEERMKDRGIVVRDWVDQREILMHKAVQGFLSHCGWNSVMEGICAGVPILAWPMMAEQPFNARMLVEEIKVGLRVETSNGSVRGFVKSEGLAQTVKELMEGEMGKEVRKNAKEYAELAKKAMEEGTGSSWRMLEMLIEEME